MESPLDLLAGSRSEARIRARERLDILIVDDDTFARAALRAALRSLGHDCRTASSGVEALEMIASQRPEVVISDFEMPGMTGAELCRRIRAEENAGYAYFILLSALHDRAHLLAGMDAGADDYQSKPIDLDELEARLVSAARVVALHRQLAEREHSLRRDSGHLFVASRTDPLTGLGNRLRMDEELRAAWARAARYGHGFSVAIVDIDHFKQLNDAFGHVAGDGALRRVADVVRREVREGDLVFRYGGEELLVLFPEQSLADARRAVERVRTAVGVAQIPRTASGDVLTVSAGVAELDPTIDPTIEAWIARADAALYRAKHGGRDRVET
jgi:two-component system chemotaxis response regulator CheY